MPSSNTAVPELRRSGAWLDATVERSCRNSKTKRYRSVWIEDVNVPHSQNMVAFIVKNLPISDTEDSSTPETRAGIFHTPSMETSKKIEALRASWPAGEIYPHEFLDLAMAVEGLREALAVDDDSWLELRFDLISASRRYISAAEARGHMEVAELLAAYTAAALACCDGVLDRRLGG